MRREALTPRPDWRARIAELGVVVAEETMPPYWCEEAAYVFEECEIETLHEAVAELETMVPAAVEHVVTKGDYERFGIVPALAELAERSWRAGERSLYGRYDMQSCGTRPPKLLEYNADTPTALFEAAVVQWHWLEERYPGADQYNSIHEGLLEAIKRWGEGLPAKCAHFACMPEDDDDLVTTAYLADLARQSGLDARLLAMTDIGWDGACFRDLEEREIGALFKLYPWDWLAEETFFPHLSTSKMVVAEPAWRVIAASKGLLAVLWELFPGHPNLLPAAFDPSRLDGPMILKPVLGREGANIVMAGATPMLVTEGPYEGMARVAQALAPLPVFDGWHPVIGAWVAGGVPHGLGIREDRSPVTGRGARFIPHRIG